MVRRKQRWCTQPALSPLIEGPYPEMLDEGYGNKKESSWEVIREWFRTQKGFHATNNNSSFISPYGASHNNIPAKGQDLRLLLGVLGCPLAPIPLLNSPNYHLHIRDIPIVSLFKKSLC